jgi:hypothetical protein
MSSECTRFKVGDLVIFKETDEWFVIHGRFDMHAKPDKKSEWPSWCWAVLWGKKLREGWGNLSCHDEKYGILCTNLSNLAGRRRRDGNIIHVNSLHPWTRKSAM